MFQSRRSPLVGNRKVVFCTVDLNRCVMQQLREVDALSQPACTLWRLAARENTDKMAMSYAVIECCVS